MLKDILLKYFVLLLKFFGSPLSSLTKFLCKVGALTKGGDSIKEVSKRWT